MTLSKSKQNAIIVGASGGIGRSTALVFASAGFRVALLGRSLDKIEALAQEIRNQGGQADAYFLDLAQTEVISQKVSSIVEQIEGVDILVNAAGVACTSSLAQTSLSDWRKTIDLNLTSVFQTVQGVLPKMREQKKGTIINVASIAAHNAFTDWGAYCVSKAGLVKFSEVLSLEEKSNGIRVMVISPGAVNTPLWNTVDTNFDTTVMLLPDTVAHAILQAALLPPEAVIQEMIITPSAGAL